MRGIVSVGVLGAHTHTKIGEVVCEAAPECTVRDTLSRIVLSVRGHTAIHTFPGGVLSVCPGSLRTLCYTCLRRIIGKRPRCDGTSSRWATYSASPGIVFSIGEEVDRAVGYASPSTVVRKVGGRGGTERHAFSGYVACPEPTRTG